MRMLVATDAIGALSSRQAGELIASGWRPSTDVSVLPVGEAGGAFVAAYADLTGLTISTELVDGLIVTSGVGSNTGLVQVLGSDRGTGIPFGQTSRPIGEAIAALVRTEAPPQLVVDLTGLWVHDAGAGLLAALGAVGDRPLDEGVDGLVGLSQLDLAQARARLGETQLVGVVPAAERDQLLLGLRGITARAGRESGGQPELMLRTDAALEAFARLAAGSQATSWWRRSLRRPWVRGACTRRAVEYRTGSRAVLAHRAGGAARPGPRGDGLFGVRLRQPRWWCRVSNGRSCVALAESMHRDRRRSADRIP